MKKAFVFLLLLPLFSAPLLSLREEEGGMDFDELKFNFGVIRQGDVVSHDFTFTNTGEQPIIIESAEVACHCTTVDFPKQPIAKGKSGTVKVTYDSKSAIDRQERTVTLHSNAPNSPVVLTFKCIVLKKK